ncbi:MAG: GspH/FimT family pseudopilin [Acidobacteriota bacterium]
MTTPPARGRASGSGSFLSRSRRGGGFSIVGLLLTIAVAATVLGLAAPGFANLQSSVSVRSAAGEVGTAFYRARSLAISRSRNVGLKFLRNGDRYEWTIYADGNGNGVRTADIARGIDRPIARFEWTHQDVHPMILRDIRVPDPAGSGFLDRTDDPIRFNGSDICSFSPIGESTPGSVYLSDGRNRMAVVRVFGRTAKMRTLYYRRGERTWKP